MSWEDKQCTYMANFESTFGDIRCIGFSAGPPWCLQFSLDSKRATLETAVFRVLFRKHRLSPPPNKRLARKMSVFFTIDHRLGLKSLLGCDSSAGDLEGFFRHRSSNMNQRHSHGCFKFLEHLGA